MKKNLLAFSFLFFCFYSHAEFGISSSAVCLTVNGTSAFYNTQVSAGTTPIGKLSFASNLGAFESNSGNLKIIGAAINTFKNNGGSVCGGYLYYIVYLQGSRPLNPTFSSVDLGLFSTLTTNDQDWQNLTNSIDLTNFAIGNYILEIYYAASGNAITGNCSQQSLDNAGGANYTASFSITNPLALNFSTLYGVVYDYSTQIKWTTQNDINTLSFEIQKSDNGLNFSTIGTIASKQTTTPNNYFFNDGSPLVGANYYRIKVNYDNGTINLSNVVRLYYGDVGNTILIYPNPTANVLVVRLAGVNKGNYQLSVLSTNGQRLVTMPLAYDGFDETLHINLPLTIPKGIYRLFMIDKTQFYKQAFMVK
jgi:hypothetical protein